PSSPTCPSTEKQKDLGRLLAAELKAMGLADAHLDRHGYVYATIPANSPKQVPVICFCSHMDTSPDCTGKNVKRQVVKNYRVGYTADGEGPRHIEDATFSADGASITIAGVATHPGFAKGKMEHDIKIAAAIVDRLPKDTCSPETTEGKEGFLHPVGMSGALEN